MQHKYDSSSSGIFVHWIIGQEETLGGSKLIGPCPIGHVILSMHMMLTSRMVNRRVSLLPNIFVRAFSNSGFPFRWKKK